MAKKIICEKCGEQVPGNVNFCPLCGANLKMLRKGWLSEQLDEKKISTSISNLHLNNKLLSSYENVTYQLDQLDKVDISYTQQRNYYERVSDEYHNAKIHYKELKKIAEKEKKDVEDLKNLTWKSLKASFKGDKVDKMK